MPEQDRTIEFLKSKFQDYYKNCELYLPERFAKREFGFLFFEAGMMQRHLSFRSKDELRSFLVSKVPMHVYHSSAYYEMPNAATMDEKNWQGADLIFDLDSDHLEGADKMSYETMLEEVKQEFIHLVETYILDDLGFSKQHLLIVFSGARGYHLHIRDPRVLGLGSHERREIVDYLGGPSREEMDKFVFTKVPYDRREFRRKINLKMIRKMPRRDDHGWKKKMRIGLESLLYELRDMGKEKALEYLESFEGVGSSTAKNLWRELFEGARAGADRMLAEDNLEIFSSDKLREAFLNVVIESQKVKLEGEADEPVTSDIKRLIRLPSSLHGKTGLMVVALDLNELERFDPLRDAIPATFGSDTVEANVAKPIKFDLKGEKFNLSRGISKIPEYAAIFLMCRRLATLI
jgi:DNA primase small subunit